MKEKNEKYYGILMNRIPIDHGIYLFKPEYIAEGNVIDNLEIPRFIDIYGTEYYTISDADALDDNSLVIGYIISKNQLLEKFGKIPIDEAKFAYFNHICEKTHIGFYIVDQGRFIIGQFDLLEIHRKLNEANIETLQFLKEKQFTINNNLNELLEKYDGDEVIAMSVEEFERILNIEDLPKMKKELKKIYNAVKEMNTYFLDSDTLELKEEVNDNITGEYIRKLFNDCYEAFLSINDLNEMKEAISKIEEVYIDLTLVLDEKRKLGYNVEEANNLIYSLVDKYDELLQKNNLNEIKQGIEKIRQEESERMELLAQKIDKVNVTKEKKHEKKELEEVFNQEVESNKSINVREMKQFFDSRIIGQEEAKKDIISAIVMNQLSDNPNDKNSCLLVGPTGSGKTLIAETVSNYLEMPMEIIDTTQLTVPGYVGANIEDFLARLLSKTGGNLAMAEEGIIVFDELDKKGSDKNSDVSGKGVLNTLLPFLQGTTYDVKYNNKLFHFNTSKLTVFATGAFTDVAAEKDKNDSSRTIGFHSNTINVEHQDIHYEKLEIEDFVKYGNIPIELMGRFSTIAQLSGHTKESLKQILTQSDISTLLAEKKKLKKINIELTWTEGYLDAVAEKAIELKTGARSLKTTVEASIKEARWEVLNNLDIYSGIILTDKTVEDHFDCTLVDLVGNFYSFKDIMEAKNKTSLKVFTKK